MRIKTPDDLAIIARQRRQALGLNQAGLAQRIGVSRKWLIDFENGKPSVALDLVMQVLNALDLPLDVADAPNTGGADTGTAKTPAIDIDAIVTAARDKR